MKPYDTAQSYMHILALPLHEINIDHVTYIISANINNHPSISCNTFVVEPFANKSGNDRYTCVQNDK